jgi:hypothetical protein
MADSVISKNKKTATRPEHKLLKKIIRQLAIYLISIGIVIGTVIGVVNTVYKRYFHIFWAECPAGKYPDSIVQDVSPTFPILSYHLLFRLSSAVLRKNIFYLRIKGLFGALSIFMLHLCIRIKNSHNLIPYTNSVINPKSKIPPYSSGIFTLVSLHQRHKKNLIVFSFSVQFFFSFFQQLQLFFCQICKIHLIQMVHTAHLPYLLWQILC